MEQTLSSSSTQETTSILHKNQIKTKNQEKKTKISTPPLPTYLQLGPITHSATPQNIEIFRSPATYKTPLSTSTESQSDDEQNSKKTTNNNDPNPKRNLTTTNIKKESKSSQSLIRIIEQMDDLLVAAHSTSSTSRTPTRTSRKWLCV